MKPSVETLPNYSRRDEIINSLTHLLGFVFGLGLFIFFIIFSNTKNLNFTYIIPYLVYAFSMMVVFGISTIYHSAKLKSKAKAILRVIDHSDIYFLIFGTYLPLCLYGISGTPIMVIAIVLQASFMIAGIVLNVIPTDNKVIKVIAYIIYIIDGWLMLFLYPFGIGMDFYVFLFVLLGGVIYTIGAILYAIGKKKIYFHSIFHVFVLLGATTQFIGVYLLLTK